jgi:hypothetical protein
MARLSPEEAGRVWYSLDDGLREKVQSGELTLEQAAEYIIPLGDLEIARSRANPPPGSRGLDGEALSPETPSGTYGIDTMVSRGLGSLDAFGQATGAGIDAQTVDLNARYRGQRDKGFGEVFSEEYDTAEAERLAGIRKAAVPGMEEFNANRETSLIERAGSGVTALASTLTSKLQNLKLSDEEMAAQSDQALLSLSTNVAQLEAIRNHLNRLPENPYQKHFIESVDGGNYVDAAFAAPMAMLTTLGEQAPTLAAQAGITLGTLAVTRNKAATARAAAIAGGVGGLSEYGTDYLSIIEGMAPEDRQNLGKIKEALAMAQEAAVTRAVIEGLAPKVAGGIGTSSFGRAGANLAAQAVSGATGEAAAAAVMGQERTIGELALEALADTAGVATEAYPTLARAAFEDRQDANAQRIIAQAHNEAANQAVMEVQNQGKAEANRAVFDAELEAERAIQSLAEDNRRKADAATMAGATQQNLFEPEIIDMFSGELTSAEEAETRRAGNAAEAGRLAAGEDPTLTDEEFEVRSQRTSDTRNQIDATQQSLFEEGKQKEETGRVVAEESQQSEFEAKQAAEEVARNEETADKTVLKNEGRLLSNGDIKQEAQRLVAIEQEGLRKQRTGINSPAQLTALLESYARKRLPELIKSVREQRLKTVQAARKRDIKRENAKLEEETKNERAAKAADKFNQSPRTFTGTPKATSPGVKASDFDRVVPLTDLLPGNQLKAAQTYTGKRDAAEREAQDAFEAEQQAKADARPFPADGAQTELPLTDQPQDGLFGPTPGDGFTGTMTPEQQAKELAEGQGRKRTLTAKLNNEKREATAKTEKEKADAAAKIKNELGSVAKAIAEAKEKRATLTAKKYAEDEGKATAAIIKEELDNQGTRTDEEVTQAVATKVAAWRTANPRPASVPAPTNDLVKKAQGVQNTIARNEKTAVTKKVNKALANEIKKGATPEEAAATVNRQLTPKEDAALRNELGGKPKGAPAPRPIGTGMDTYANTAGVRITEPLSLRNALDSIVSGNSRTKLGDLLRVVAVSPHATVGQRWLANRLAPLATNLGIDLTNVVSNIADRLGEFSSPGNFVGIQQASPDVILHEAIHAVTSNLLIADVAGHNPQIKKLKSDLQFIMGQLSDKVKGGWAPKELMTLLKSKTGPLSNMEEFLAYALTDERFKSWLSSIQVQGARKNLWQEFKDSIINFFSPRTDEARTALDAAIEATESLVQMQETTPKLNAMATAGIRQGFWSPASPSPAPMAVLDSTEEVPDFGDPITQRTYKELAVGNVSAKFKPEWTRKPVGAIVDALTAGAGNDSVISEIFDRAQSATAALILKAEQLYKYIDFGLEEQSVEKGEQLDTYRAGFIDAVKAFEEETDRKTKAKLAREIRAKYTDSGRAYFQMRRTIDKLSRDILSQRLADPRPFTTKEAKIYRSIRDNLGSYYTRVYASNTAGVGKERAKKLWKEYRKWVAGDRDPELADGYQIVRDATVFIRDKLLMIPDAEGLESMSITRLKEKASAWGLDVLTAETDLNNPITTEQTREVLTNALLEFAAKTPQARENRAIAIVEDMLFNRDGSALTNYYRGAKQDRTIVTEREAVPKEIRQLLGEFEDLPLRAVVTITRQAEFRARTQAFHELIAAEQGKRVLTQDQFDEMGLSPQDWTKLKGDAYGPLDGLWVRNDIAARVEDSAQVERTFDQVLAMASDRPMEPFYNILRLGAEQWAKRAGQIKAIQLVWNMGNMLFNFVGGPAILLSNGNFSVKNTQRAFATASALIKAAREGGNLTADMQKVVRAGITDSAFMGEIRAVELDQIRQLTLDAFRTETGRKASAFGKRAKTLKRQWKEAYAMADVVWKIANFYSEEEKMTAFYEAEGIEKTPEQIEREAAWKTNVTNFSYKRVPNLFKMTEKAGLSYIMPYIYETFRAPVSSFIVGIQDIQTAKRATSDEGRQMMMSSGVKRILGSLAAMGVAQQAAVMALNMVSRSLGESDEEKEEWVRDLRAFMPEYKKYADFMYAGQRDGNPVLFEVSRLDPFGPMTEFYRMAVNGADPDEYVDAAVRLFIANPYGKGLISAFMGQGVENTRMSRIDPEGYKVLLTTIGERGAKAVDTLLPSWFVRATDPLNRAPEGEHALSFLTYMGVQVHQVDAPLSIEYAANDFKATRREIRDEFTTLLRNAQNLDDEQILDEYVTLQDKEAESFERLDELYNGLLKMGYSEEQALAALQTEEIKAADLGMLYSGGYIPEQSGVVSMAGLESSFEDAMARESYTDAKKLAYYNNIQRVLALAGEGRIAVRGE